METISSIRLPSRVLMLAILIACELPTASKENHLVAQSDRPTGFAEDPPKCESGESGSSHASKPPVQYIVSFPRAERHYAHVSATVPTDGAQGVELMMPVWTPGSYLVREYAKHVENVSATTQDGEPLGVHKTRKNRWQVEPSGGANIVIDYDVYGHEMSVRTNWIDSEFAFLVGAATFMTRPDALHRRHDVRVNPPRAWRRVITGLSNHKDSRLHFRAADFDELVDSPILVGNPTVHDFKVAGTPHRLANLGGEEIWDEKRSVADTQRIVEEELRFWGQLPYAHYTFQNLLVGRRGGLEHKNSTAMMFSRWGSANRKEYLDWLGLVAHEFFHTWNVKRLRPVELGPFDYENENYTPSMWVAEGLTSYYDDLIVKRAGLMSESEYLESLSRNLESVMTGRGRLVQSMRLSSFDAWIKLYRPDENLINSGVSYYSKGALVGLLLDAEIRLATQFTKSLDDVMRRAYALYSGRCGYTDAQFRAVVSEVSGKDMSGWLAQHLDRVTELSFDRAMSLYGLRLKAASKDGRAPQLGIRTTQDDGRLIIKSVIDGGAAALAGLNADDELLGLNGYRVTSTKLGEQLQSYGAGDSMKVLVARREKLLTFNIVLGPAPDFEWMFEIDPDAKADAVTRREAWLSSPVSSGTSDE